MKSVILSHIPYKKEGEIKSFSHKVEPNDPKIIKAIQDSIEL